MAQAQLSSRFMGYRTIDPYLAQAAGVGASDMDTVVDPDTTATVDKLRTQLKTVDAGLYTDAYLDTLNQNDLRYAVMLAANSAYK